MRAILPTLALVSFLAGPLGAAEPAKREGFPLSLAGKILTVRPDMDRESARAALAAALPGEVPSVDAPERLQYDAMLVPDQAPLTLVLDFDPRGRLAGVTLDAFEQERNPPARALAAWLAKHAGPGLEKGGERRWRHAGFVFTLTEIRDAGEDSMYLMEVAPLP